MATGQAAGKPEAGWMNTEGVVFSDNCRRETNVCTRVVLSVLYP